MTKAKIVVLSGPSGVGKGTVHAALRKGNPDYALSVSVTTRAPRDGEVEGVHYFYRTQEQFEQLIKDGCFVEYAKRYENWYGTLKSEIKRIVDSGKHCLLDIEFDGAKNIKDAFPEAVLIYLLPPSLKVLKERITGRQSESAESLEKRCQDVLSELDFAKTYDYILVNDQVQECVNKVNDIVNDVETAEQYRAELNLQLIEMLKGGKSIC
jgi:guanylate kinase